MWRCYFLVILCTCAIPLAAQPSPENKDLQAQIEQLQKQLAEQKRSEREKDRVTEIGEIQPTPHAKTDDVHVVRIYDLSDLFATTPSYPPTEITHWGGSPVTIFKQDEGELSGGGGFGGGAAFDTEDRLSTIPKVRNEYLGQFGTAGVGQARTSFDDLITAIKTTITPDQWSKEEGAASISKLGNHLLVSANERTHAQLETLLGLFRKRWGSLRTISIATHWLWITQEQLQTALDEPVPGMRGQGAVSKEAFRKLQTLSQETKLPKYQSMLTCYNGQTVGSVSGNRKRVASQLTVVEDEKKSLHYHPSTVLMHEGAALQVSPLASSAGTVVVLDIHTRVNRLVPLPPQPADAVGAATIATDPDKVNSKLRELIAAFERGIDQREEVSYSLSTTLRVPVDQHMLIGGMNFSGTAQPEEPNLYLFTKVMISEFRDDQPAEKPLHPAVIKIATMLPVR